MGGGNGQKSKTKRDRNNEKKMKEAKQKSHAANKGKMTADKEAIKCKICMTTFMVTASVRLPLSLCRYAFCGSGHGTDALLWTVDGAERPLPEQALVQGLHDRAVLPAPDRLGVSAASSFICMGVFLAT